MKESWYISCAILFLYGLPQGFVRADYDKSVLSTAKHFVMEPLSAVDHRNAEFSSLYASGLLKHNDSESNDDAALRGILFSNLVGMDQRDIGFMGGGFESGYSLWWYPPNSSHQASIPPTSWHNTTASQYVFEHGYVNSSIEVTCNGYNDKDYNSGLNENCAVMDVYYTEETTGNLIKPSDELLSYNYNPRNRKWYMDVKANGSQVSAPIRDSHANSSDLMKSYAYLMMCTDLRNENGDFVGAMGFAVSIGTHIEKILALAMASTGGVLFIIENAPPYYLIAASDKDTIYYTGNGTERVKANDVRNPVISKVADMLSVKGYPESVTFRSDDGDYIIATSAQVRGMNNDRTLLDKPWLFVNAQIIYCATGYEMAAVGDETVNNQSSAQSSFACIACTSPKTSAGGSSACSICIEGYYLTIEGDCEECPDDASCAKGTTTKNINIDEGYWRASDVSTNILPCLASTSDDRKLQCRGGSNYSTYCGGNSKGPYCSICQARHYKPLGSEKCKKCGDEFSRISVHTWIFLGIAVLVLMYGLRGLYQKKKLEEKSSALTKHYIKGTRKYSRLQTKIKISVSFAQVASSFPAAFGVSFPNIFIRIVELFWLVFGIQIIEMFPISCYVEVHKNTYMIHLLFTTLGPLLFIGILWVFYVIRSQRHASKDQLLEGVMFWFLFFTYVIYQPCSSVILDVFNCDKLEEEKFLYTDYTTQCDPKNNGSYRIMVVYAVFMILIYPVGCPLMYFTLMWRKRSEIDPVLEEKDGATKDGKDGTTKIGTRGRMEGGHGRDNVTKALKKRVENHHLSPLAFLFESYEPEFWWWEILVCCEKLIMTNTRFFFSRFDSLTRPYCVLFLALFFVKIYSQLDPYILDSDDLFAEIKGWMLVIMTIFCIFNQLYDELGKEIPAGSNIILTGTLASVLAVLSYYCLKTIGTEVTFFKQAFAKYFPRTHANMVKWEQREHKRLSMDYHTIQLPMSMDSPATMDEEKYEEGKELSDVSDVSEETMTGENLHGLEPLIQDSIIESVIEEITTPSSPFIDDETNEYALECGKGSNCFNSIEKNSL